MECKYLHLK